MLLEIASAVEFLCRLIPSGQLTPSQIDELKKCLGQIMSEKFSSHWDVDQPFIGNAYRAICHFAGRMDPILYAATLRAQIEPSIVEKCLPKDLVLWVDPFSVSYRVGDYGLVRTLYEDRSRGKVTLKVPSPKGQTSPRKPNYVLAN
ncbi:anti-proliferative protein [Basidiobolus meristosporus CBS 931.73]|uniref:Anti-proliferative protein n=1 Tax=Basidiobolus meristosporus CBS 931.73 TaxID=1314790 RepID=A0A1Y1Y132_9FUNG|nr:anti-proliferative protein [Basidiobolus meristosporus CBS 931.73]|eukprot:ORX91334.1 anti-proliferative protein [Basidiobolus meristosporus CBS 931.73]